MSKKTFPINLFHPPLLLILALFGLLGIANSIVTPLFEAPDEVWHFSFIHRLATDGAIPVQPTEGKDMWLREVGQPPLYHLVTAVLMLPFDHSSFPTFVRFNPDHRFVTPHSTSEAPNLFIHTPQEEFPYRGAVLAVHVARLATLLWGMGTVVGVYLVAREVWPDQPGITWSVTAVSAFNPHFLYISSVVNNDATIACTATWVLWLAVRHSQGKRNTAVLGAVLGLALLSKLSALALVPLVGLAVALRWWQTRNWQEMVRDSAVIFSVAAAVAGWWYGRNWLLYGDPLAWQVWLIDIGEHHITWTEVLAQFRDVARSFWEPYDHLFPPPVFWLLGLFLIFATVGLLQQTKTLLSSRFTPHVSRPLLLITTWFVLVFASLVRYMLTTPAAEGRLLFAAIAPIAVLLGWGWEVWGRYWVLDIGKQFISNAQYPIPILLILLTVWTIGLIAAMFPANRVAETAVPALTPFSPVAETAGLQLLGATVQPETAESSQPIDITLYWQVQETPPADLNLLLQLWTPAGQVVGQWDRPPAYENYPPDLWQVGDIIRDPYRLRVAEGETAVYRLIAQLQTRDEVVSEWVSAYQFTVLTPADTLQMPVYRFGEQITLQGYETAVSDSQLQVTLYWQALGNIEEDYQVFLHVLDEQGQVVAQGDGPPLANNYPTSYWVAGQTVADVHVVELPEEWMENGRLLLGLYQLDTGTRLPVYNPQGEPLPDNAISITIP